MAEIADRMGYSNVTIERAVSRYGIARPNRLSAADRIDAKKPAQLRQQRLLVVDIAERLGCSKRTAERALQV